jgi:alpha/beta superfamily hydrolase
MMSSLFQEIMIPTTRGSIAARYYASPGATSGIVWIGGIGGFWDGIAGDLYTRTCESLLPDGITSIRLTLRCPTQLDESVTDALAGIAFLQERDIRRIGLVGHSFAGAVAIRAAVYSALPVTVVSLAAQSHGAELVGHLPRQCSLLLIHGTSDEVLHVSNSEYLATLAHQPKQLLLFEGAKHKLDEVAQDVYQAVRTWLHRRLGGQDDVLLQRAS